MAKLSVTGYTIKLDNGVDPASFDNSIGVYATQVDAIAVFMKRCGNPYETWSAAVLDGYRAVRVRKEER